MSDELRDAILKNKLPAYLEELILSLWKTPEERENILNCRFPPCGMSLLHYAMGNMKYSDPSTIIAYIDILVEYGIDINIPNNYSMTPLQTACERVRNNDIDLAPIRRLLELGARTDGTGDSHLSPSPLHIAVKNGNKGLTKLLVQFGADIYEKDFRGMSSLDYVSSDSDIADILLGRDQYLKNAYAKFKK